MFRKIKSYLGIEGVKIKLTLPAEIPAAAQHLEGTLTLTTMHPQVVTGLRVSISEHYVHGRGASRKTEQYLMGDIAIRQEVSILPDEPVAIPFVLPFSRMTSRMDDLEQTPIAGSIVRALKWATGVSSTFEVLAEATVAGTKLQPFDRQQIALK